MANDNRARTTQKNRLKRQIVSTDTRTDQETTGHRLPLRILPGILVILLILGACAWYYLQNRHTDSLSVQSETALSGDSSAVQSFRAYLRFGDGVLLYSKDGAAYTDRNGRTVFERSYQMQNPIAEANGTYAVIADQGAQSIYIFNQKENTGVASTVYPVSRVAVSETGVVYAILRDDGADYITAFKPDGSGIDLSIKSVMTGDGYPTDLSVSPDGTELLTSYVAVENAQLVQKAVFRNFDEVGKAADARRVVGGFTDEFEGHLIGRVHFSSNESSQAFYDGGIVFFSTKVLTSPEVSAQVSFDEEIHSIAYSDQYAAVILNTAGGENPYRMMIYSADGSKLSETEFDFPYTSFSIEGDRVLLYNEDSFRIYNVRGRETASADFPVRVSFMTAGRLPGEYLLCGEGKLLKVKLG